MKKFISILFVSVFLCFAAGSASAESILYDWWVDVDGNLNDAGAYYTAPTRNWGFDADLLDPTKLPPGTPMVNLVVKKHWAQLESPEE